MNSVDLEAYKIYSQTSLYRRVHENMSSSSSGAEWKFILLDKKFAVVVPARYDLEMLQIRQKTLVQRGLTIRSALRKPATMPHALIEKFVCKSNYIRRDLIKTAINRISTISSLSNKLFSNPHSKHIDQIDYFSKLTLSTRSDVQVAAIENKIKLNNADTNQAGSIYLPVILTNKLAEKSDEIMNISNKILDRSDLKSFACSMNVLSNNNVVTKIPTQSKLNQFDKTFEGELNSTEDSVSIDKKISSVLSVPTRKISVEFQPSIAKKSLLNVSLKSEKNEYSLQEYYSQMKTDSTQKNTIKNVNLKMNSFDNKDIISNHESNTEMTKQKSISNIPMNQEIATENPIISKDKKKVSFKTCNNLNNQNLIYTQIKKKNRRATVLRHKVFNQITILSNKFNNLNISNTHTSSKRRVNRRQKKVFKTVKKLIKNPRLISKANKVQNEMDNIFPEDEDVISTNYNLNESEKKSSGKNFKITFPNPNNNEQSEDFFFNQTTELIENNLINVESKNIINNPEKVRENSSNPKDKIELQFESKERFARNYNKLSELDFTKPYSFSYFDLPISYLTYNRNFIRLQKYKEVIASIRCVGSIKFLNLNLSKLKEKRIVDSIFEKIANFKQNPTKEVKLNLSANDCYHLHRHIKEIMSHLKHRPDEFKYGRFHQLCDKTDLVCLNLSRFESMDLNQIKKEIDKI